MMDHLSLLVIAGQIRASNTGLPQTNFDGTVRNTLRVAIAITALLSVIFVAVGGLKYTLASGDAQQIAQAKNTILSALVGLALAILSGVIFSFVLGGLI